MSEAVASRSAALRRRGLLLEYVTIGWNVIEAIVAVWARIAAGSIALIGFGLDSLIEVFVATVGRLGSPRCQRGSRAHGPAVDRALLLRVGDLRNR